MLLELIKDAALTRQIAQQDPLPVADGFGADVLVSVRILEHRVYVHAAFVGEGAVPDIRLSSAMKRAAEVSCVSRSLPMVECPIFNSRLAMMVVRFALPQRSP